MSFSEGSLGFPAFDGEPFPETVERVFLSPFLMRSRHWAPVLPGLALDARRGELGLRPIRNLSDWLPSPGRLCPMAPPRQNTAWSPRSAAASPRSTRA